MKKKPDNPPATPSGSARPGEVGIGLLLDALRQRQRERKLSTAALAKSAGLSVQSLKAFEQSDAATMPVLDLLAIARVLGAPLELQFAPERPRLPVTAEQVLASFDKLIRTKSFAAFYRNQQDNEHPQVRWDIVGDPKSNWLYVVATNTKTAARFAKVTDSPGGWAIAGQVFGIDAETDAIARDLSEQLFREHREKLLAGTSKPK